jgi:hypothetical protein
MFCANDTVGKDPGGAMLVSMVIETGTMVCAGFIAMETGVLIVGNVGRDTTSSLLPLTVSCAGVVSAPKFVFTVSCAGVVSFPRFPVTVICAGVVSAPSVC